MFESALAGEIDAAQPHQLDELATQLWQCHANGQVSDEAAQRLADAIAARKSLPEPAERQATAVEIVAHFMAIDRQRIRRRSYDVEAPECRIDRNEATRILVLATAVERKTYKHRAKGQHGGAIGDIGIQLLQLLLSFSRKYGRIFPRYDRLAAMLRKDRGTVIAAMKRLINAGFVTKHRRSKLIDTPDYGSRRVQDSNAYEVHMPQPGLGIAGLVQLTAPESNKSTVSSQAAAPKSAETIKPAENLDLWWMPPPYQTAGGDWI
jgi:hypothetical protein